MGVTPRNTTISLSKGCYCYNVRKIKVIWPLLRDEAVVFFNTPIPYFQTVSLRLQLRLQDSGLSDFGLSDFLIFFSVRRGKEA